MPRKWENLRAKKTFYHELNLRTKSQVWSIFLSAIFLAIMEVLLIATLSNIAQSGSNQKSSGDTQKLIYVLLLLFFRTLASWVLMRVILRVGVKVDVSLGGKLFESYLQMGITDVEKFTSSELVRTLDSNITQYVNRKIIFKFYVIHDLLIISLLLLFLFVLFPLLGATFIVLMLSFFLLHNILLSNTQRVLGRELEIATTELIQKMYSLFRFTKVIRAEGLDERARDEYLKKRRLVLEKNARVEFLGNNVKVLIELLTYLAIIVVFLGAMYLTESFEILPIVLVGVRLLGPLNRLLSTVGRLRATEISANQLEEFYGNVAKQKVLTSYRSDWTPDQHQGIAVTAKEVSYTYLGNQEPSLREISFTLRKGQVLIVQGPIGSGKSTLLDLILGLRTPSSGDLVVFGQEPIALTSEQRAKIKYLPQEAMILKGTVRENLLFGNSHLSDSFLEEFLRKTDLNDIFPNLDQLIGESHKQLSGGERQMLGLIRVLIGNPSLMILDESTSNLDFNSQSKFLNLLQKFRGTSAIIFVTHRDLTSDLEADLILNLGGN